MTCEAERSHLGGRPRLFSTFTHSGLWTFYCPTALILPCVFLLDGGQYGQYGQYLSL
jgi:hypothetical protein